MPYLRGSPDCVGREGNRSLCTDTEYCLAIKLGLGLLVLDFKNIKKISRWCKKWWDSVFSQWKLVFGRNGGESSPHMAQFWSLWRADRRNGTQTHNSHALTFVFSPFPLPRTPAHSLFHRSMTRNYTQASTHNTAFESVLLCFVFLCFVLCFDQGRVSLLPGMEYKKWWTGHFFSSSSFH